MIQRIKSNWKYILSKGWSVTVFLYALLGFIRMFVSLESIINSKDIWYKLLISIAILAGVFLISLIVVGFCVLFQRRVKVVNGSHGKGVYVVYGDLFDEKIITPPESRRNICFAVNRCFDTIVDEKLISSATIHGQAMNYLYSSHIYDRVSLDQEILKAIPKTTPFFTLDKADKPEGKLKRYPPGTAVDLKVSDNLHFFMVGVSAFDNTLTPHTSTEEYCLMFQRLIEFCDRQSQGYPVLMPIIASGLARVQNVDEKTLLDYMIKCFTLNKNHIKSDIYIVVRNSGKKSIPIMDLKMKP